MTRAPPHMNGEANESLSSPFKWGSGPQGRRGHAPQAISIFPCPLTPPPSYDEGTSPYEWGGERKPFLPIQMGKWPEGPEGSCAAGNLHLPLLSDPSALV